MAAYTTENIRNIALLGHGGSGKTSLADAMYLKSGVVNRLGSVNDQTSNSDFEPEEQSRGGSIQSTILPCPWDGDKINVIDTPGYADFRGDMVSGIRVADAGVLVISAVAGIEVGAGQAWEACNNISLPRLIIVNKLDRENTEFDSVVQSIRDAWGRECTAINMPDGSEDSFSGAIDLVDAAAEDGPGADMREQLVEAVAESDDDLAEKFLEELTLTQEDLVSGLKSGIASGKIIPILAASALNQAGIDALLDVVVKYMPSPLDETLRTQQAVSSGASANFVFKTSADPFVGKISYVRVYGSPLMGDSQAYNQAKDETERIGQVYEPKGKEQEPVLEIITGDIGVIPKLSVTQTGDTLSDKANPVSLESITFPPPVFGLALTPSTQADLDKMADSITRMVEEDPSLQIERNPETSETVMHGLGDTHVETAVAKIERKFGVSLETALPKIAYKETITGTAKSEYKHKKQSGGHGQYGHVIVELAPLARGAGFEFASKVVGGNVPKEYIPAVEKGVRGAMAGGVLAGFPVVDVGVTLTDGSSHSVDSSGMAFEIASSMALRQGVNGAQPALLEPIMAVTITAPDDAAGDVISDLNSRRAQILGMVPHGDGTTDIEANVPQAELQRYATDLRSLTQARAFFKADLSNFAVVPQMEAQKVIAKYKQEEEVTA